jgi:hypothetical protein
MRHTPNYQSWLVNEAAFPQTGSLAERVLYLCRYGLLAPSVHNTQPWQFRVDGATLHISFAAERLLDAGDPTGRERWLSLGACVETLVVAGRHFGLVGVPRPVRPEAEGVMIDWTEAQAEPDDLLLAAITARTSNRAPYADRHVHSWQLERIRESYQHPDLKIVVRSDRRLIGLVARLTGHAIGLALSNPRFKHELAGLLRPNWTDQPNGMPGFSTEISSARSAMEAWLMKHAPMAARQAAKERRTMHRSAALVLVFSRGDTKPYWLEAGRAYQHCGLVAASLGLSQATTAAVVEASDYHLDVEATCHTDFRLQTTMRLGYGPVRHHAPRFQLKDLLG